jgi:ClpP class serine protease
MNLLLTIIRGKWAISKEGAMAYEPMLQMLISGQSMQRQETISPLSHVLSSQNEGESKGAVSNIAVITVSGVMTMEDQWCGPVGTATLAKMVQQLDASSEVDAIIMEWITPGGQVMGTEQLANAIGSAKKPIYSLVHLACSAGYWCASQADEVWMAGETAESGSIGVMCRIADTKGMMEKMGIQMHEAYASTSADKNLAYRNALEGEYGPLVVELDALDSIFMSAVQKARPSTKKEALSGGTYLGAQSIAMGLADRIGSMQELTQYIVRSGGNKKTKTNMSTEKEGSYLKRFVGIFRTDEDLTALKAEIDSLKAENTELSRRYDELYAGYDIALRERDEAKKSLELETLMRKKAEELANTYGSQPGALGTEPIKKGADGGKQGPVPYFNPEAQHNIDAQALLNKHKK